MVRKLCIFSFVAYVCARGNSSSHYISLDVYYGTRQEPCTNDLNGWAPSLDALEDPKKCYGIDGDHNITCISRRMSRMDDEEQMLSTSPLRCALNGFQNNDCSGMIFWPAQPNPQDQTWTWVWDQEVGLVDIGSFTFVCH